MVSLQHFRNYQLPILKILDILIQTKSSPKSQQTTIKQHPENPQILDILIQTKSSPKSQQTTIKQHPEKSQIPTNNHPTTS
ncbi:MULTISPECIES: hypothetical protein [unclassified Anabaena]|jgi:hypothetical protein|uniref:hypothetical protein n=1 Tax=unclassified Anabaena TaxID=2619674 RepID=UPI0006AC4E3B|nr:MULTISPECIES: hypothetical protein [unclassified Anabaena]ALB40717.1 hypothetical protein AA650_09735 [Anabaena sp. WA102]MBO1065270.1 hypothetical protein [Anabaena sp. 54]OBQ21948.1 MAG: hypothetical protein AN486_03290 [Anabaena sp. AL93]